MQDKEKLVNLEDLKAVYDTHFKNGQFKTKNATVDPVKVDPAATVQGTATGNMSYATNMATASGNIAHAVNSGTASGADSHAENEGTASGIQSHAEGGYTVASGRDSHAQGLGTIANHLAQTTAGMYNKADTSAAEAGERGKYIEVVGNGTADNARSNARTLDWDGDEELAGDLTLYAGSVMTRMKVGTQIKALKEGQAMSASAAEALALSPEEWNQSFGNGCVISCKRNSTQITWRYSDAAATPDKYAVIAGTSGVSTYGTLDEAVADLINTQHAGFSFDKTPFDVTEYNYIFDLFVDASAVTSVDYDIILATADENGVVSALFMLHNDRLIKNQLQAKLPAQFVQAVRTNKNLALVYQGLHRLMTSEAQDEKLKLTWNFRPDRYESRVKAVEDHFPATGRFVSGTGSATKDYAHAEGNNTTSSGNYGSHAEGRNTTASGDSSHAEGRATIAQGANSHAEGNGSTASGATSHSEGIGTRASGDASHAEGSNTTAAGKYSHSEGFQTVANRRSQRVFGEYNASEPVDGDATARGTYVEIVGNGTSSSTSGRSNARTLDWEGNERLAGDLTLRAGHANYETDITGEGVIKYKKNLATRVYDAVGSNIKQAGPIVEYIGIPPYVSASDLQNVPYSLYNLTEPGWYALVRVYAPFDIDVSNTTATGIDGTIRTHYYTSANGVESWVEFAIRFDVAATSKTVVIDYHNGLAKGNDIYIVKATDLAVRNLDYRTTFYIYDLAPFATWTIDLAMDRTFKSGEKYFTLVDGEYVEAEVTADAAVPAYFRAVYTLTADTTFADGKTYYTESGGVYTAATVTTGDAVTADTYYELSYEQVTGVFEAGETYYTESGGVYTAATVTAGDPIPAYYHHSKLTIQGMTRNVTYQFNEVVDCPQEYILPEIEDDGHGAWFEIRLRHSGAYSSTLVVPEGVKVATEHTQAESAGFNMVDLHYQAIDGVKIWRFMNTHSTIPTT